MSEQELRGKIVKVLTECFGIMPIDDVTDPALYSFEGVADALIAAGIGDVSELKKHRMMIAKDGTIQQLYSGEEVEQIVKEREEYKRRSEVWEQATRDMIYTDGCFGCHARFHGVCPDESCPEEDCMKYIYAQAENELQEERKGD